MGRARSDKQTIKLTLPQRQVDLLDALDEVYGTNRAEKVRGILTEWFGVRLGERALNARRRARRRARR